MKNYIILFVLYFIVSSCDNKEVKQKPEKGKIDHKMNVDELHLSNLQIQLGNITVDSLREHILGEELNITGTINLNQNKVVSVSSRVMGRIEKLYLKNTGGVVSKGEPLYDIYSEDLSMAVKEYLLAKEKFKYLKNEQIDMGAIVNSAKNKLLLYGLSEKQINSFENKKDITNILQILSPVSGVITAIDKKEGDYIMEGGSVFHLADFSTLWVEGQVYSDHLKYIKEGMIGKITFPNLESKEILGKIIFINPELNQATKINTIRIEITNENKLLKPGMQTYINILTNQINALSLPTDAILIDGKGSTVWVQTGVNMFKSKMVTTGLEANGFTEIKSGLNKGDIVVITGAYLLNSEYVFKKGTNPMEGHAMAK